VRTNSQTGIAILGCGYWGVNYVRVFTELPDSRVVMVCDRELKRLDDIRERFPGVMVTADFDEVLELPSVEAIVIATEATTHYKHTTQSLQAGKHVLVEKPLATSVTEAESLDTLAKLRRRVLMVGHTFLYNPGIRALKDCVRWSAPWEVYYLYSRRTSLGPIRHDVNAAWDLASHDVAIFSYLLDDRPEWVSAVGAKILRRQHADVSFISLGYRNGIIGHIHVSWADPNKVREVVIVGSDKRIVFNDLDPIERLRIFKKGVGSGPSKEADSFGDYHFTIRDGPIVSPVVPVIEPLRVQCGHFLDCIRRGAPPLTNGLVGSDVVRAMDAIDDSISAYGAPVAIDYGKPPQEEKDHEHASAVG
jgi:predicted dehydrogenase